MFFVMIIRKMIFNPDVDIQAVDQVGFIDLVECVSNNSVPSFVSDSEGSYNDIDDPASILGKPHDTFEAVRLQKSLKQYKVPAVDPISVVNPQAM